MAVAHSSLIVPLLQHTSLLPTSKHFQNKAETQLHKYVQHMNKQRLHVQICAAMRK